MPIRDVMHLAETFLNVGRLIELFPSFLEIGMALHAKLPLILVNASGSL